MKTFLFLILFSLNVFAVKVQQQGIKTAAECVAAGATAATCSPLDSQIYSSVLSKQLDSAIVSTNTASTIVSRDSSGNFAAGTITASLAGNASTATALAANPTDCGAGTKAISIDALGNLTCSAVSLTADVNGILAEAHGGTNQSTYTTGDMLYASATNTLSKRAAGTVGQRMVMGASVGEWHTEIDPQELINIGMKATEAANALTIALTQADGATNCSATSPCRISFRDNTTTNGDIIERNIIGALSLVIRSGDTIGHNSGENDFIYLYAMDNSGTVELAVSSVRDDNDGANITTTALSGGAQTSAELFYSTTARTGIQKRLIGVLTSTQATAGTWVTAPTTYIGKWGADTSSVDLSLNTPGTTTAGYGSTNTLIRRYTVIAANNLRNYATYADSATAGMSVTIHSPGMWAIDYGERLSSSTGTWGITVNDTALSTSIISTTYAQGKRCINNSSTNVVGQCVVSLALNKGDIVRAKSTGSEDCTLSNCIFHMTRIGDIHN